MRFGHAGFFGGLFARDVFTEMGHDEFDSFFEASERFGLCLAFNGVHDFVKHSHQPAGEEFFIVDG